MSVEFKLPALGENVESGEVVKVLVRPGDVLEGNQGVVELETDKAVIEVPCPHAGKVVEVHVKQGDTVTVGQTLVSVDAETEAAEAPPPSPAAAKPASSAAASPAAPAPSPAIPADGLPGDAPLPAGPAARRLARQLGIALERVQGSGARGRITPEDVRAAAAAGPGGGGSLPAAPIVPPGTPGQDSWGPLRVERMSKIRRTIAAQMVKSAGTIPHVTNFDDADVTDLEHLRKGVPKDYLGQGVKLTAMPFVLKAVAAALGQHPLLNATLDEANQQVIYKQYVNLGVAVDTPRGLVVPVLRGVERMTIPQLARGLAELARKARAVEFTVEDLRGGTFTLSNLGAVGGSYSTPLINHPEVAILLLGRSRWMPVVRQGRVEPRLMMPLSLSYDHRLVDGAAAARFLNEVIGYLESPARLLLVG